MPDLAIETESLRKHFDRTVAVADLSLAIRRGEVFGFLGPNGAGKTTSLKLLLGLIDPTGGAGTVLGAPLGTRGTRSKIGFLPEHFRFHDCLTGRELLRIHGRLFGLRGAALEARIDALLARVALTEAADRRLQTYSKGMIQRAGLAQALVNSPELVFLDEPTSGLDPLGRVLVRSIIEELRDGRHDGVPELASARRGRGDLRPSRVREEGARDRRALARRRVAGPRRRAQARRARSVPCSKGSVRSASSAISTPSSLTAAMGTAGRSPARSASCVCRLASESALPELAPWLVARGIALYELRVRRKSLEESFIEIMGDDQTPG